MFIRYLEISPKEYLEQYRIRKASALLRTTDLTVGSIATSVGYDNGLYFSKAFRRMTGQSPTECRMEAREAGREDAGTKPGMGTTAAGINKESEAEQGAEVPEAGTNKESEVEGT